MLNRRHFITGMIGVCAVANDSNRPVLPAAATVNLPQPTLPASEQMMYATVRLFCDMPANVQQNIPARTSWGTGFFFNLFHSPQTQQQLPVIVTNKHVIEHWNKCSFSFHGRLPNGSPDLKNHIPVELSPFAQNSSWFAHPTVDLAIIPIGGLLTALGQQGRAPFYISMEQSLILTNDAIADLLPLEQILTVGYPGRLWDDVHNLPVAHRGYTATAPYIDFKGNKEFLVDIATWPGASGSPVMLYNDGSWPTRNGGTVMGGTRAALLGVVYGVAVEDISGNVSIQQAPTQAIASVQVPTNLGACIQASRVLEFEPLLVKTMGIAVPAGYRMRAK
jgi:hypothetical protein